MYAWTNLALTTTFPDQVNRKTVGVVAVNSRRSSDLGESGAGAVALCIAVLRRLRRTLRSRNDRYGSESDSVTEHDRCRGYVCQNRHHVKSSTIRLYSKKKEMQLIFCLCYMGISFYEKCLVSVEVVAVVPEP